MKFGVRFLFFLGLLTCLNNSKSVGQNQSSACIDSLYINQGRPCNPDYEPVCGCDNKTYRNQCLAEGSGVTFFQQGPCENLAFDCNPNPPLDGILYFKIFSRNTGTLRIFITNYFGKFYFDQYYTYPYTGYMTQNIDVSTFEPGVYFIFIVMGEQVAMKKIVKSIR
jgi:hypothetical protein